MVYQNGKAVAMSLVSTNEVSQPSQDIYSTEETVIGQWIDGKPIYRKIYEVGAHTVSTTESKVELESSIDIDALVKVFGYADVSNQNGAYRSLVTVPFSDSKGKNIKLQFETDKKQLNAYYTWTGTILANKTVAVVEYTKITDQVTIELPAMLLGQNTASFDFGAQTIPASAVTAAIASAESVDFEEISP